MAAPIKGTCWERFISCICCETEVVNPTGTNATTHNSITQQIFDEAVGNTHRSTKRHARLSSTEMVSARTFIQHSGAAFDKYIAEKKSKQAPDGK